MRRKKGLLFVQKLLRVEDYFSLLHSFMLRIVVRFLKKNLGNVIFSHHTNLTQFHEIK